jgi:ubiquinone/menaquinone biosynthesis C-methylase UbiE
MRSQAIARTRYLARQHGIAISLRLAFRALASIVRVREEPPPPGAIRAVRARFAELLAADWDNAARGVYPRALLDEFPIAARDVVAALPLAITDLPRTLARIRRGDFNDLPEDVDRDRYPAYYLRNFHWQTDGWLSDRSAKLYDFSVDVLFGGATDAMRRMALPAVVDGVRGASAPRVLDVACGTGRFLGTLAATLPGARLYGVDLSPAYVARARARRPDVALLVENAESLPFAGGTFDAVTCVFLLHELPRDVRRRVLGEILRVLRPGGVLSVCDSAQLDDSADLAFFLHAFHRTYHVVRLEGRVGAKAVVTRRCPPAARARPARGLAACRAPPPRRASAAPRPRAAGCPGPPSRP